MVLFFLLSWCLGVLCGIRLGVIYGCHDDVVYLKSYLTDKGSSFTAACWQPRIEP